MAVTASSTTTAATADSAPEPGSPVHTPVAAVPSATATDTQPV